MVTPGGRGNPSRRSSHCLQAARRIAWCVTGLALGSQAAWAQQTPPDTVGQDSALVLAPIQVSVARTATDLSVVPFAVSVLSGRIVREGRPTLGLDESLVEIPGVFVANRYNQSLDQRVSIRGFGARSAFGVRGVKILLDGVPQTLPDGQGQLSNVDLATIGSVEVLRGSASSLYGNASGGVIDLRTASPDPTRPSGAGRVAGGAYGMLKWTASAGTPLGRGTAAVNASRTTLDGFREHSESEQWQVGFRLQQRPSPRTEVLFTTHFASAPQLDNPGSLNATELEEDPSQANPGNVNADAGKNVQQAQVGLTVGRDDAQGRRRLTATLFGLTRDLDNPLSFATITLDRRAWGARAEAWLPFTVGRLVPELTVGIDLQRQRDDRLNRSPDDTEVTLDQLERVLEVGPFAKLAVVVDDRVAITGGVRFDRVSFDADDRLTGDGDASGSRVMSSVSGSIGATVVAVPAFQPYVNVSTSFETPTTTELVNRPTGSGGFNPELEPQTATTIEFGMRGRVRSIGDYELAVFTSDIDGALIPFEVPAEPGRQFFRNAGSTRHRGIEIGARLRPAARVALTTAYTFADYTFTDFMTEDGTFDGNAIPGVPRHHLYGSLHLDLPSQMWVASDHTYSSTVYLDDANSAEASGWYVSGLRAGWTGRVGRARVVPYVGVHNLFDERYVSSVVVNARFGRFFEPAPPRNAYVGMEVGW